MTNELKIVWEKLDWNENDWNVFLLSDSVYKLIATLYEKWSNCGVYDVMGTCDFNLSIVRLLKRM